jgi:hypothetical protein
MRIALGILLLVGGLLWAIPGVWLLAEGLLTNRSIQVGPNESIIIHDSYFVIDAIGQRVGFATACAVSLVPGALFFTVGLYFLFTDGRRHMRPSDDRETH